MVARTFDPTPRLSDSAILEIERDFDNVKEAHTLLDLIDAEFRSDPMSTQCFDLRIVERVRKCVALYEQHKKDRGY